MSGMLRCSVATRHVALLSGSVTVCTDAPCRARPDRKTTLEMIRLGNIGLEQSRKDQTRPEQSRAEQTREDQNRPDQTRPERTRADQTRKPR